MKISCDILLNHIGLPKEILEKVGQKQNKLPIKFNCEIAQIRLGVVLFCFWGGGGGGGICLFVVQQLLPDDWGHKGFKLSGFDGG